MGRSSQRPDAAQTGLVAEIYCFNTIVIAHQSPKTASIDAGIV